MKRFILAKSMLGMVLTASLAVSSVASADSLLVNFTADLTAATYNGPSDVSPYTPGTAVNLFAATQPDVIRADGQFYLKDWDGSDGTFTTNVTPGSRFLLHSPLIERVEIDTWRAEGPSDHGTLTGLDNPISQRKKFLLPTNSTYGSASITIANGALTDISYNLDFSQPGVPPFQGAAGNPAFSNIKFNEISLSTDNTAVFGAAQTYTIGTDDDAVVYGLNTQLSTGSFPPGVLNGTVIDTTRGMLRDEILNNIDEIGGSTPNISSDGRQNGIALSSADSPSSGPVYLQDPFLGESGTLTVFDASAITVGLDISVVPEPTTAMIAVLGSLLVVSVRRRA